MVLMAIDHVRVYSGVPAGGPTAGIFFTRWVTHFCAPAFVFFAGTAAFFYARKSPVGRFLVTRGLLLVLLELTVIRFTWTFNLDYAHFTLAGVIWMLGWCMVLLAGLVRLPVRIVGIVGLGIIFFQQAFRYPALLFPQNLRWIWEFVYPAGAVESVPGIAILYVLVPWIGVMAAGYGFGKILLMDAERRDRWCWRIGLSAIAIFLVGGGINVWLAPVKPNVPPAILRLLNQQKYPASALFLMMTLGPVIALMPWAERARGWFGAALAMFGRVPMFYYLLHIPLIHIAALLVTWLREGAVHPEWYASAPFTFLPPEHRWGLPLLYLVWAIVVALLYMLCRWFAAVKARGGAGWLRYI